VNKFLASNCLDHWVTIGKKNMIIFTLTSVVFFVPIAPIVAMLS